MRNIDPARFSPYEQAFRPDVRIGDHAYSLCGGPCAGMFVCEGPEMLRDLIRICIAEGIPYRVTGGLSNLLVSDEGFDGIILMNRKGRISHSGTDDGSVLLTASSGVSAAAVVRYCVENELSGFEWACGLPGTIGGAVYGNAGAFGTETADIFIRGNAVNAAGETVCLSCAEMGFAYRNSRIKREQDGTVLLDACFRLGKGSREEILARGEANRAKRQAGQPVGEPSLGSVFKNPEGCAAGKLIQDAGLKGVSVGKATVSMKHANFITTEKGVRSADYRALIRLVRKTVMEKTGILLEPEIEFLGFEDRL